MPWFRLLAGLYECADPDWEPLPTDPPDKKPPTKTYKPGDVFFNDTIIDGKNLADRFGHDKFQYLGEEEPRRPVRKVATPKPSLADAPVEQPAGYIQDYEDPDTPPPPVPNFDSMSMAELKDYATSEEIDLSSVRSRTQIIKRLKEARSSKLESPE